MPTRTTNISGFPEYLPAEQLAFNEIIAKIAAVYQSFGFVPLETAAVERIDTLTSKGIDSKEVYALRRLNAQGDDGDKDIALRFDLTVPLARYVAQNYAELTFPFRRYQCQPVWRGERAQKGRYRQFHQFDIDTITDGEASLPLQADAEIIAAAAQAIRTVLPENETFTMRVNNRKVLAAILAKYGYADTHTAAAIKIIDDLEKVGRPETIARLKQLNSTETHPEALLNTLMVTSLEDANLQGINGLSELQTVFQTLKGLLGNTDNIKLDLTIARGLDYYTGTVVETRLEAAPELGSICSGGRYDNLTESLSSRKLPGVGISIGISRLATWLMEQPQYQNLPASTAGVIVTGPNAASTCQKLRAAGISTELALGDKSPGQHFQAAQKRGIAYGVIAEDKTSLRTFATRESAEMDIPALIAHLQANL